MVMVDLTIAIVLDKLIPTMTDRRCADGEDAFPLDATETVDTDSMARVITQIQTMMAMA